MIVSVPIPPPPGYFITDTAHVISAATQQTVEAELEAFERKTTDQVVVWIGESTGDTPLEDWTIKAAQQWRIGERGVGNGVVLFLFMKDRRVRIEVGSGLESTLTDATAAQIERDSIEPALSSGNPDKAVTDGVAAILHTIGTDAPSPAKPPLGFFGAIGAVFGFIFRAIGAVFGFIGHLFAFVLHAVEGIFYIFVFWISGFFLLAVLGTFLTFFEDISKWFKTGKPDDLREDFIKGRLLKNGDDGGAGADAGGHAGAAGKW